MSDILDLDDSNTVQSDNPVVRVIVNVMSGAIALIGLAWAGGVFLEIGLAPQPEQILAAVLALGLGIVFLTYDIQQRPQSSPPCYDVVLAVAGTLAGLYLAVRYPVLSRDFFYLPVQTNVIGGIVVLLVIEGLRRSAGWSLFIVLMCFLAYALFGHLVPGQFAGRSLPPDGFFAFLAIDNTAMLGVPMTVITTVVIIFVFFGQVLLRAGGSDFFTDIAAALMGRTRGGSAKIAVIASGFFGSISGSAVSNVVSTGVITIPLMRRSGYSAPVAAAIEAVASTGGQIMPPIMGAAAFLMVELLGTTYQAVVVAAIIPSVLYFTSVFVQADLEAGKRGIAALRPDQIPAAGKVFREGWYFLIPFAVLLFALFQWNAAPEKAALYGVAAVVAFGLAFSYSGKKLTPAIVVKCLAEAGRASVDIIVIGAAAGIILGILDRTGMSFGLTFILVQLGQTSLLLLLLLTAIIGIILGMGMPTTAIYFLLATLAAPPIIKLGVDPLAAHMFVLYFGMMSMITPPVALASFTAAKLAGAPPMATAVASCRFGWPAFVIPFLFVLSPTLIMKGPVLNVLVATVTAIAGIWITSGGMTGYLLGHLSAPLRVAFVVGGLCLLIPSQTFPYAWVFEIAGGLVCLPLLLMRWTNRQAAPAGSSA